MDEVFLGYYNEELQYLRELGAEFAAEYPKVAGRLGMQDQAVSDPYVERLLEGFAFLTARVRLKQDAQFPRFTKHLLDAVYPNFLGQMPSMAVAQFTPDPGESSLVEGYRVARHSSLLSLLGKSEQTRCEFRTGHDVTLWPLSVSQVRYHSSPAALSAIGMEVPAGIRAGLSLTFETTGGQTFDELSLDDICVYLKGTGTVPGLLYKQLIGDSLLLGARQVGARNSDFRILSDGSLSQVGFLDEECLLPDTGRAFGGYRLLQEYFAFPDRFMFVNLCGLKEAVTRCTASSLEVVILLKQSEDALVDVLSPDNFALFCTPVVNLFERRSDRIQLSAKEIEHHVVPDRTRPMDFEVWGVNEVRGIGGATEENRDIYPLYGSRKLRQGETDFYFVSHRESRRFSARQRRQGARTNYLGSETSISIVAPHGVTLQGQFKQLEVKTLCSNRDLPLQLALGQGMTDFELQSGGPVQKIRCVAGPSAPKQSYADGETTWQLINLLSTNYLTFADGTGAETLKELLKVFESQSGTGATRQLEGIKSISARGITARMPVTGPQSFGRGLEVKVVFDEASFEGAGVFLFGAVLERFFGRLVTMNSFTQVIVSTQQSGEIMKWPIRAGRREIL